MIQTNKSFLCGAGAFGYFEVTHDISRYCKAKVFEHIGKTTPIAVRFSTVGKNTSCHVFRYDSYLIIVYNFERYFSPSLCCPMNVHEHRVTVIGTCAN